MRTMSSSEIRELAADIEIELEPLKRLEGEIQRVQTAIQHNPEYARLFYENLGLKLHNFYTGCERIFRLVASDLNGALPSNFDWHRRLLNRMAVAYEGRPAVITAETSQALAQYLAFRHVVRNIYGFELESQRVARLVAGYPPVWHQFEGEVRAFVNWLRTLAEGLDLEE